MAEKAEGTGKKRKTRAKGNFGIFVSLDKENENYRTMWGEVESGLESTVACEKFIKENAEQFQGKTLMIAQIKRVGEIKVQTTVKVSF